MLDKENHTDREKNSSPKTLKFLWVILLFLCVASLVPELFVTRSGYFGIDGIFGFHSILGLASCVALVLLGKLCGLILKRREDYYQD